MKRGVTQLVGFGQIPGSNNEDLLAKRVVKQHLFLVDAQLWQLQIYIYIYIYNYIYKFLLKISQSSVSQWFTFRAFSGSSKESDIVSSLVWSEMAGSLSKPWPHRSHQKNLNLWLQSFWDSSNWDLPSGTLCGYWILWMLKLLQQLLINFSRINSIQCIVGRSEPQNKAVNLKKHDSHSTHFKQSHHHWKKIGIRADRIR